MEISQNRLSQSQIERFHTDGFAAEQVQAFTQLIAGRLPDHEGAIVDVGGGLGYFAASLSDHLKMKARVVDSDEDSIAACKRIHSGLEAFAEDALAPTFRGDEKVVCFNLILHHLVAGNEKGTRELQQKALKHWAGRAKFIFVNEYVYESFLGNLSGRLIFEITKSKPLSAIASVAGRIFPSLKANTLGVGVRFRSRREWMTLVEEAGFEVLGVVPGEEEPVSLPRRALFIKSKRRDSFLIAEKC